MGPLRQNAFGLFIGRNPYATEFVAEEMILRGGDGGCAMHSGAGHFAEWVTLASAYTHPLHEATVKEIGGIFGVQRRRAYSLF